jgi:hypothetical protein
LEKYFEDPGFVKLGALTESAQVDIINAFFRQRIVATKPPPVDIITWLVECSSIKDYCGSFERVVLGMLILGKVI